MNVSINPQDPTTSQIVIETAKLFKMSPQTFVEAILASLGEGESARWTYRQIVMVCLFARETGLNPFLEHIWLAEEQDDAGQCIGYHPEPRADGWIALMNNHAAFDGLEFRYSEQWVESPIGNNDGKSTRQVPMWIEAVIQRKDRSHPVVVREFFLDAVEDNEYWRDKPMRQLRLRALTSGIRFAFGKVGARLQLEAESLVPSADEGSDRTVQTVPEPDINGLGEEVNDSSSASNATQVSGTKEATETAANAASTSNDTDHLLDSDPLAGNEDDGTPDSAVEVSAVADPNQLAEAGGEEDSNEVDTAEALSAAEALDLVDVDDVQQDLSAHIVSDDAFEQLETEKPLPSSDATMSDGADVGFFGESLGAAELQDKGDALQDEPANDSESDATTGNTVAQTAAENPTSNEASLLEETPAEPSSPDLTGTPEELRAGMSEAEAKMADGYLTTLSGRVRSNARKPQALKATRNWIVEQVSNEALSPKVGNYLIGMLDREFEDLSNAAA